MSARRWLSLTTSRYMMYSSPRQPRSQGSYKAEAVARVEQMVDLVPLSLLPAFPYGAPRLPSSDTTESRPTTPGMLAPMMKPSDLALDVWLSHRYGVVPGQATKVMTHYRAQRGHVDTAWTLSSGNENFSAHEPDEREGA